MKNRKVRVAIHYNESIFKHSTSWHFAWINYCEANDIDYSIVDCYKYDILETLKNYDCLVWHFSHYSLQDMLFARSILMSAENMGLKVFPDIPTSWHFDDKIAETYLLESIQAPTPKAYMFYTLKDFVTWLDNDSKFPIVAKLRCGSGSNNVKLLNSRSDAYNYGKKIFGKGLVSTPSILYKGSSQLKSAKSWATIKSRIKRIPDFIESFSKARRLPRQQGYVYLQEFIPNAGFDLKIVVIGDKLSFIARNIREGEFRASGSGSFYFDRSLVTKDIIDSAFSVSDRLRFQCMGYDYVIDDRDNIGKIIEMSYGFSHTTLLQAGGYWDRSGEWHDEPLNAPEEILKHLIEVE